MIRNVIVRISCIGFVVCLFVVPTRAAEQTEEEIQAIVRFFEENVMERTLSSDEVHTFSNPGMKVETQGRKTFTGFARTLNGFSFREVDTVKRKRYDLDDQGAVVTEGKTRDSAGVAEFTFGQRRSTGRLVGTRSTLETTWPGRQVGVGVISRVTLEDNKLTMTIHGTLYEDHYSAGTIIRPRSTDSIVEFSIEDGKLQVKTTFTYFDVDPDTLVRTSTGETMTVIFRE